MATTVTLKPNAIDLSGSTSGTTTLQATAVAGTTTITLPAATDTLVGKATTDTLTNKTLTTPIVSTTMGVGGATASGSGSGITFPATQSASSDANTLDDYEEGTWTPNQGSGIVLVGTFSSSAKYTKIGRQVTLVGQVQGSTSVANVTNGGRLFTNAPFSASPNATGVLTNDAQSQAGSGVLGGTDFYINPMSATPIIYFTITYFV